jgi:uncharacterized protein (DUF433 family)
MNDEQLLDRIDPAAIVARPVLRATRVPVEHVLTLLVQGESANQIQRQYPGVTSEDVQACLLYASRRLSASDSPPADSARQPLPPPLGVRLGPPGPSTRRQKHSGPWVIIAVCVLAVLGTLVPLLSAWILREMVRETWQWEPSEPSPEVIMELFATR